jgi:hypothetical protein
MPLPPEAASVDSADEHDAQHLYRQLEQEIVPLYYTRDARGETLG